MRKKDIAKVIHKPEDTKKRLAESVLAVVALLAVFWSLAISKSRIDQYNANLVLNGYYWWFFGVVALVAASFSALIAILLLKVHKHPLPIFLILLTLLSLTLLLTSGWLPVVRF